MLNDAAPGAAIDPAQSGAPIAPTRFPCMDGLRAIAAMGVFVAHAAGFFYLKVGHDWTPAIVQTWLAPLGGFGVAVFFVLSGFLLYRPFVLAHFEGRPTGRVGPFWLRRFARIFPAYWLVLTISIVVLHLIHPYTFADYATFYGLLLNYRVGYALFGFGVEWTLVIEVSFYVVLPAIAWLLRSLVRSDASIATKLRTQVVALILIAAASTAFRAWNLWVFSPEQRPIGSWFSPELLGQSLFSFLDWFAIGMLMAVVSAWLVVGGRLPRILDVITRQSWISWLLALGCYAVLTRLHYPWFGVHDVAPFKEFMRLQASIAAAAFLVLPAVFGNQEEGVIRGALRSRAFVAVGLISYGIYLWHVPFFDSSRRWGAAGDFPTTPYIQAVLVLVLTLAAATVSYFVVERPARIWIHRLTR